EDEKDHDAAAGPLTPEEDNPEPNPDPNPNPHPRQDSAVGELLELVFRLSITFSIEEFIDGQPSSSLLIYFSGILGFSTDARSFLLAKHYTTHLSGLDLVVDLATVKDDLTNTEYGFSFVQHPANGLADAYLDLLSPACTRGRDGLVHGGRWSNRAISLYRKKAETFLETLVGGLHVVGGQTGRGSELFSLECQNGLYTERGVYVYNRSMITLTRHHKAKRSNNGEF